MSRYLTSGRARFSAPAAAFCRPRYEFFLAGLAVLVAACDKAATGSSLPISSIEITPASLSLSPGTARPLIATARDGSGSAVAVQLFWAAENAHVATVSSQGLVTAVAPGRTQVAASKAGKSAVVQVNVTSLPAALVRVSPTTTTVNVGASTTLTAEVFDAGGGTMIGQGVSWASDRISVATVQNGVVTGVATGTALVSATAAGLSATAVVSVQSAPSGGGVASVSISPASATVQIGKTVQLTATARDVSGKILSGRSFNWSSSNTVRATVVNGLVTGVAAGSATITASTGGKSGTASITVR